MMDQLPAIIPPGALAPPDATHLVPALIANEGKHTESFPRPSICGNSTPPCFPP